MSLPRGTLNVGLAGAYVAAQAVYDRSQTRWAIYLALALGLVLAVVPVPFTPFKTSALALALRRPVFERRAPQFLTWLAGLPRATRALAIVFVFLLVFRPAAIIL